MKNAFLLLILLCTMSNVVLAQKSLVPAHFEDCDGEDKKNCTLAKLESIIYSNLELPEATNPENYNKDFGFSFKLDDAGKIIEIKENALTPPLLAQAVKKAAADLPPFVPATLEGEPRNWSISCWIRITNDQYFLQKKINQEKIDAAVRLPETFDEDQREFVELYLKKMIFENLIIPEIATEKDVEDDVVVSFEFDSEGAVSKILILKDPGYACGEAVKEALMKLPKMSPAIYQGIPVASRRFDYNIPFGHDENFYETVANSRAPINIKDIDVLMVVEDMPRFAGCENIENIAQRKKCASAKMNQFIYGNLQYPIPAKNKGVEGTIVIRFIIMEDGSVANAEIVRDLGHGTGEEGLRVVESMPNWIPGRNRETPVNVYFNLPIKFRLQ